MKELAVIRKVTFGYIDNHVVGFSAEIELLSGGALINLPYDLTVKMIERKHINNLNNLINTTCVVEVTDESVKFVSFK